MNPSSVITPTANFRKRKSEAEDADTDSNRPQAKDRTKQSPESPSAGRRKQKAKEKRQRVKLGRRKPDQVAQQPTRLFSAPPGQDSFCGRLIMRARSDAYKFATSIYTAPDQSTRVFWTDGSYSEDGAGAAVVYRPDPREREWAYRGYAVSGLHESRELELFAIGAALKVAVLEADTTPCSSASSQQSPPSSPSSQASSSTLAGSPTTAVTVFTDCKRCLDMLGSWINPPGAGSLLSTTAHLAKQVVRLWQQLRDMGVVVEVHWAPAHMNPPIPGHKEADLLAKTATRLQAHLAARSMDQSVDGTVLMVGADYL
jgi:ribonuclease HI